MSNSTKAGEQESLCGLKVRGEVMDTRLRIWWTGIAEPMEFVDCNKLKLRFNVFTPVLWPGLDNKQNLMCFMY